ncbi:MAG: TatD family hydrolase [Candidatus Woesearchaeota archaeon]
MKNILLIDVHAHLDLAGYEQYGGIDKVLEECAINGMKAIIANGVDIDSNRKTVEIARRHPIVKLAFGIYPTHCLEMITAGKEKEFDEELRFIEENIKNKKCAAIGEVGLEYKEIKDITEKKKEIQKSCLVKFIQLAKKYNIPIIIHSRGAELEVIELLEKEDMKGRKVIMHCFSGRKHLVQRIRDNKWIFSIPCNVDRSLHFQQIVKDTSMEQLVTETDAPYLGPILGKTNRPDNVIYTIKKIAEIKGLTPEEVGNMIYANYQRVFT